jgi:hypothetical protein
LIEAMQIERRAACDFTYWSQASVRRAYDAMVASRSSDLLVLARLALEAAN